MSAFLKKCLVLYFCIKRQRGVNCGSRFVKHCYEMVPVGVNKRLTVKTDRLSILTFCPTPTCRVNAFWQAPLIGGNLTRSTVKILPEAIVPEPRRQHRVLS